MSVINQMLKDLELRHQQGFAGDPGIFNQTSAVATHGARPDVRRKWWLFAALCLITVIISVSVWRTASSPVRIAVEKHPQLELTPEKIILPVVAPATTKTIKQQSEIPVLRETLVVVPDINKFSTPVITAIEPTSIIANGKLQTLTVRGEGFALPLTVTLEWDNGRYFKQLATEQITVINDKQLEIHFKPETMLGKWMLYVTREEVGSSKQFAFIVNADKSKPSVLPVATNSSLADKVVLTPATKPKVIIDKTIRRQTAAQKATLQFENALALLQRGKIEQAERAFGRILVDDPQQHKARELLVGILYQDQRLDDAIHLLETGLVLEPAYLAFTSLHARLLAEQGDLEQAIAALEKRQPEMRGNENYYALLAALYQRAGQYGNASNVYTELLTIKPEMALWWMGLGISQQSLNHVATALTAYKKALARDMQPVLRKFIHERIRSLR